MQSTDVKPTRLGAAQDAVRTFIARAPSRLRIGLIVFAGEAQVATPPTRDHDLVRQSVDNIDRYTVFGGTAIGDALRAAVELGKQALSEPGPAEGQTAAPASPQDVRQLTGGFDSDEVPEPPSRSCSSRTARRRGGSCSRSKERDSRKTPAYPSTRSRCGTPTGTVPAPPGFFNFGSGGGRRIIVPPDPATLRAIAETTGGKFSEARSATSLQAAYSGLRLAARSQAGEERGHVPLRRCRGACPPARSRGRVGSHLAAPSLSRDGAVRRARTAPVETPRRRRS